MCVHCYFPHYGKSSHHRPRSLLKQTIPAAEILRAKFPGRQGRSLSENQSEDAGEVSAETTERASPPICPYGLMTRPERWNKHRIKRKGLSVLRQSAPWWSEPPPAHLAEHGRALLLHTPAGERMGPFCGRGGLQLGPGQTGDSSPTRASPTERVGGSAPPLRLSRLGSFTRGGSGTPGTLCPCPLL
ncbi:hypothetical protein AAFF_G00200890 [Aldrovandia affinis]|uniref:Uncharacterized protein n=1 Tax=Aldrovandia affinis TaxID=143900 RepID=A0AAD7RHX4_9TELE|nr:hypothetical protein AAFF_G00200890 [Aldrovandia affinis]